MGARHPHPDISGGGGALSPKKFFRPFGPQFGLHKKGKRGGGGVGPRSPLTYSSSRVVLSLLILLLLLLCRSMKLWNAVHIMSSIGRRA